MTTQHSRFGGPHLEHMRIRGDLFDLLLRIAHEDGLDQWAFARMLGVSQPRASDLVHRHIEKFNRETLIDILARVGVTVDLQITSRGPYRRWNFPLR